MYFNPDDKRAASKIQVESTSFDWFKPIKCF